MFVHCELPFVAAGLSSVFFAGIVEILAKKRGSILTSQTRLGLSEEGEAMNRPQGDQAMRPMVPVCPRQMHRSLIPGTTSLPTSMKSPAGSSPRVAVEEGTPSAESTFLAIFTLLN